MTQDFFVYLIVGGAFFYALSAAFRLMRKAGMGFSCCDKCSENCALRNVKSRKRACAEG